MTEISELPGYQDHMRFMTEASVRVLGAKSLLSNFRLVDDVGVMDIQSEKGLIPIVAAEIYQPYFADYVRQSTATKARLGLSEEGRPDAVLDISAGYQAVVQALPRANNKLRQYKKAQRATFGYSAIPLPWRASYQHLMQKYDGLDVSGLPDDWFDLPKLWWNSFKWVTLTSNNVTLGGAIFQCSEDKGEWFWIASALDYDNPEVHELSVGNVLLMRGLELACSAGARVFNFGVDRFEYKPLTWGTKRRWTQGMEYLT